MGRLRLEHGSGCRADGDQPRRGNRRVLHGHRHRSREPASSDYSVKYQGLRRTGCADPAHRGSLMNSIVVAVVATMVFGAPQGIIFSLAAAVIAAGVRS